MKKILVNALIPLALLNLFTHCKLSAQKGIQSENLPPNISDGWVATDALGREMPDYLYPSF